MRRAAAFPFGAVSRLGAGEGVGDLVQHRVPDLGLAGVQSMGPADADHAVLEVAVAKAPLGFEEGEGPVVKTVLVHQLPRHRGDAGEAFRAVACLFLPPWATHAAQPAVGDVPKGPAHAHPGLRRVELHDLAAPRRPVGARERHPVAHPPLGARRIVARHHRGAAGEARGRQRHLRHLSRAGPRHRSPWQESAVFAGEGGGRGLSSHDA